jgi:hypothetical protein
MLPAPTQTPTTPALVEISAAAVSLRSVAAHWLVEVAGGLDLQRQGHFLATFTPALIKHFKAEEEVLEQEGIRGRQGHRKEHHRLAVRLVSLVTDHGRGRSVAAGIQQLLEAWLLHQEGDPGATAKVTRGH